MEHPDTCPFLNDSDSRCNRHFRLDHMDLAFKHCFGDYESCPIAAELLGRVPRAEFVDDESDPDLVLHLPVLSSFQRAFSQR